MIEFPPGTMIEIDSGCYPEYDVAKVLKRIPFGYIVILDGYTLEGFDYGGQTIIFDSEVVGMADDGQSPDEILEKIRERREENKRKDKGIIIPVVKRPVGGTLQGDCITPEQEQETDAEKYDRAMKGIM